MLSLEMTFAVFGNFLAPGKPRVGAKVTKHRKRFFWQQQPLLLQTRTTFGSISLKILHPALKDYSKLKYSFDKCMKELFSANIHFDFHFAFFNSPCSYKFNSLDYKIKQGQNYQNRINHFNNWP